MEAEYGDSQFWLLRSAGLSVWQDSARWAISEPGKSTQERRLQGRDVIPRTTKRRGQGFFGALLIAIRTQLSYYRPLYIAVGIGFQSDNPIWHRRQSRRNVDAKAYRISAVRIDNVGATACSLIPFTLQAYVRIARQPHPSRSSATSASAEGGMPVTGLVPGEHNRSGICPGLQRAALSA